MADDGLNDAEENLFQRQKRERKEFQGQIQKLKHSIPKGDKKKKKEVAEQIARLQAELELKHKQEEEELESHTQQTQKITEKLQCVTADDGTGEGTLAKEKGKRISKAQKRRDKKSQKDRERSELIAEQDRQNEFGQRNVESEKLKSLLALRGLQIHEIASDGNCLYNALVHQLEQQNIKTSSESLRQQTADYMKNHADDFLPFLTKPDSGDVYSHDEFNHYCDEVASTSAWGGHLELRALSHVLKCPIEVVQAEAPSILLGEEFLTKPLVVVFHHYAYGLGEHYNSVSDKFEEKSDLT